MLTRMIKFAIFAFLSVFVSLTMLWPQLQRTKFSAWSLFAAIVTVLFMLLIFLLSGATRRMLPYYALLALLVGVVASVSMLVADKSLDAIVDYSWFGMVAIFSTIVSLVSFSRLRELRKKPILDSGP